MNEYIAINDKKEYVSCVVKSKDEKGNYVTNLGNFNKNHEGLRKIKDFKLIKNSEAIQKDIFEEGIERMYKNTKDIKKHMSAPTRTFEVGERVSCSHFEPAVIERIYDDGKFYLIKYSTMQTNYGNPYLSEGNYGVFAWTSILKNVPVTEKIISIRGEGKIQHHSSRLQSLIFHYYGGIDMKPEYQRGEVWEVQDQVDLIDSIFKSVDIGKFALVYNNFDRTKECGFAFEMLDGKQRLKAIIDFYEDRFRYRGYLYSELSNRDKGFFTDFNISIAEADESLTMRDRYRYFLTMNTKGKVMDKVHLANIESTYLELEGKYIVEEGARLSKETEGLAISKKEIEEMKEELGGNSTKYTRHLEAYDSCEKIHLKEQEKFDEVMRNYEIRRKN